MRKIILLQHSSLDGFIAGPRGEMNWIHIDEEIFDEVEKLTRRSDTAIYGRVTYQMMEAYWPTAGRKPGATKHDIEHSSWANKSLKLVLSKTMTKANWQNTMILADNIPAQIRQMKNQAGKDMLMIGSAQTSQLFMQEDLIDEYWISVNPVMLGAGLPLFRSENKQINLRLLSSKNFNCGTVGVHYERV